MTEGGNGSLPIGSARNKLNIQAAELGEINDLTEAIDDEEQIDEEGGGDGETESMVQKDLENGKTNNHNQGLERGWASTYEDANEISLTRLSQLKNWWRDWKAEVKLLVMLGLPAVASETARFLITTTDISFLGHLGDLELAAAATGGVDVVHSLFGGRVKLWYGHARLPSFRSRQF
jgi:hypothetical protein